jgi:3-oxoacyl-[acyl-carrier-protein] synthase III
MSGRELWDFTRVNIVPDILNCIKILKVEKKPTDVFIHQASRLVVDGIKKEIDLDINLHENYSLRGNTVSSTLPILLKDSKFDFKKNFVLSGFGVGIYSYTAAIEKI